MLGHICGFYEILLEKVSVFLKKCGITEPMFIHDINIHKLNRVRLADHDMF